MSTVNRPDAEPGMPLEAVGSRSPVQNRCAGRSRWFFKVLVLLQVGVTRIIPGVALGILIFFSWALIPVVLMSINGIITQLTGTLVLRSAAPHAHFADYVSAVFFGLSGGILLSLVLMLVPGSPLIPEWLGRPYADNIIIQSILYLCVTTLIGTLGSTLGSLFHLASKTDIGHATLAGVVGGAIWTLGSLIVTPFLLDGMRVLWGILWSWLERVVQWFLDPLIDAVHN